MINRDNIIKTYRTIIAQLSKEFTKDAGEAITGFLDAKAKGEPLTPIMVQPGAAFRLVKDCTDLAFPPVALEQAGVTIDCGNAFAKDAIVFNYGNGSWVSQGWCSAAAFPPVPENMVPATDAEIDAGVALLSDKRVSTINRNMALAIHATFPNQTATTGIKKNL